MDKYEYPVLAFRQQRGSPIQVAFVAHAAELLHWAGIPRKSEELLTGFQRFKDDKRIDEQIVPFFQNPENCSPTAAIVALRADSGLGRCSLGVADVPIGEVVSTTLRVEVDSAALQTEAVFECASRYVSARLEREPTQEDGESEEESEEEAEDDAEAEDEAEENGDEEEISVHLGTETLAHMKVLLDDRSNWSKPEFRQAIADYVKPAFLIDGQHRIFAAARLGEGKKGLPFIICGLFNAPWEEQVFQFTVVNLKPKRISPSLITSIAALSLSRYEQELLRRRLEDAGVRMTEVEIMSLVAYDDSSPFAGLVDMGVGHARRDPDKVGYGAMKRIAKVWYRAKHNSLVQIAKHTFDTNNPGHARNHWRAQRTWFEFFAVFWSAVRDHYPDPLWTKSDSNNLFVGYSLWALQEALLTEANGQIAEVWEVAGGDDLEQRRKKLMDKLLKVVRSALSYLPAELWTKRWAKTGLDTNQGREEAAAFLKKLIDAGKAEGRVPKKWAEDEWFAQSGPMAGGSQSVD